MKIDYLTLIDSKSGDGVDITWITTEENRILRKHIEHISREDHV